MKFILRFTGYTVCMMFSLLLNSAIAKTAKEKINVVIPAQASSRVIFGATQLVKHLNQLDYQAQIAKNNKPNARAKNIILTNQKTNGKESYAIVSDAKGNINLASGDESGALYAFITLTEQVKAQGKLPENLQIKDKPEMVLRGTAIGLQKPDYLPGRDVYEYPYTPETFPWFYDKQQWIAYLDMMLANRYNSLYLWNGHPFSSLVKLKEYPYALEVDEATFKKNEEIFKFLTEEADKRGIWVIQMFYNILIPKPFAEKHGLKTQDRNRPIIPIIADYTQKSIAAFVQKYPNVGLLVTLGEAMEGVGQDDINWFTKTIIPGVQDGLKALGSKTEPPIVLRAHDSDAPAVMKAALPLYKNLYTMAKYNGEALTTYTPRGKWADLHRSLSRIGTVHVQNVHILANLEPFRYGSADFIQKSVQAMHHVYEANALHLYPQASYWDWPYTADKAPNRLMQLDRDWIWYKAWARYAWDSKRERSAEIAYWSKELGAKYGANQETGKHILDAYEESGEISPKLLRRFGITDGNRQTLTLGMLTTQFINPFRYGVFTLMYESEAPEGEMIIDYAEKEWKKQGHIGETPVQVAKEVVEHGRKAIAAIEKAKAGVKANQDEFDRLLNDMYCYDAMANFYADKVTAALWILKFKYSNDVKDLDQALPFLESSVQHYQKLVKLTENHYLYANSMQTKQRKIPMRGVDKTFIHWKEVLPVFETELKNFKHSIDSLKSTKTASNIAVKAYENAVVKFQDKQLYYTVKEQAKAFADEDLKIKALTPELIGLNALQLSAEAQIKNGTQITFTNAKPVTVLVGFFNKKDAQFSPTPELETDASANNYGQAESKISNAIIIENYPAINVHAYTFPAGKNTLSLAKGKALVLGFIDANQKIKIFDAGLNGNGRDIDWLFGYYAPTDVKL